MAAINFFLTYCILYCIYGMVFYFLIVITVVLAQVIWAYRAKQDISCVCVCVCVCVCACVCHHWLNHEYLRTYLSHQHFFSNNSRSKSSPPPIFSPGIGVIEPRKESVVTLSVRLSTFIKLSISQKLLDQSTLNFERG